MEKAKFWLVQIVMVAFVGLVMGSPAMAHSSNGFKGYGSHKNYKRHSPEKRDKWYHKKMERKIAKQERRVEYYKNKIAKYEDHKRNKRWMKRLERKLNRNERKLNWYMERLARHNAKYHVTEPTEPTEPEECPEGYTGTQPNCVKDEPEEPEDPTVPTCADLGLSGVFPNCS